VRIGKDKAFTGVPIAQMSVLEGYDLEWFHAITLTSDVRV
jgi:hypothetical protein